MEENGENLLLSLERDQKKATKKPPTLAYRKDTKNCCSTNLPAYLHLGQFKSDLLSIVKK